MLKPFTLYFKSLLIVFTFLLAAFSYTSSSAQNVLSASHGLATDPTQRQVELRLSAPLGAAFTCLGACPNWTLTIGGVPVAITSIVGGAGSSALTVNFATPIGIGQAVTISLSANSGTINAFGAIASVNAWVPTCADFTFQGVFDFSLPCSPVDPKTIMIFAVSPRARNSNQWVVSRVGARVSWRTDLTAPESIIPFYESNVAGSPTANTNFIASNSDLDPGNFTYPGNEVNCGYTSFWHVRFNFGSVVTCPIVNPTQRVTYASHNTDALGEGDGQLLMNPLVANSDKVCEGQFVNMRFTDVTDLNCVDNAAAPSPLPKNNDTRWVRVIYGSPYMGAANTIPNIFVGATQVTDAAGNLLVPGGFIPLTPNALGTPDPFGVVQVNSPVLNARGNLEIITTSTATPVGSIGKRFFVTLQYWNVCNPYTTGSNANVRQITDRFVEVVDAPDPPVVPNKEICVSESRTLSVTSPIGGATYRWYSTLAQANAGTPVLFTGTAFTPSSAQAPVGVTSFFVTASNNAVPVSCTSPATQVTLTRRVDISAAPPTITGSIDICRNSTYTYSLPVDPAPETPGGNTEYVWTIPAGWTLNSGQGTKQISVTTNGTTGATSISVIRRYVNAASSGQRCDSNPSTLAITVRANPTAAPVTPVNICEGTVQVIDGNPSNPFGSIASHLWTGNTSILSATNIQNPSTLASAPVGTYNLTYTVTNSIGCTGSANVVVNISANPGLANAGPDQPLCQVVLTSNAFAASNPAPGVGTWTIFSRPAGSTATNANFSNQNSRTATFTGDINGQYILRWTVVNGTCNSSDDVVVDFGTDPGPQSAGPNSSTCGTSFVLAGSTPTIGTGTWTLVTPPPGGTVTFSNANSPTSTVTLAGGTPVFGAYTFRWSVVSGTCAPRTANVTITFSRAATASVPANFNSCVDGTTLAAIPITGTVGGGSGAATQTGRWEIVPGMGSGTFTSTNAAVGLAKIGPAVPDSYKPVAADFTQGFVELRLVAVDPDGALLPCGNVNSATHRINFDRVPTNVNAGPDQPLVCTTSTPLAALLPVNGNVGTWTGPGGVTFSNINDRLATVSNLPVGPTTLRWTVTSALNLCTAPFDEVIITRNALPVVNNLTPSVCEATPAGGSASGIILTANDNAVTGGAANTSVAWFTDPGPAGPISPASTPQNINNAAPASLTFFTRVTNSVTTCQNTGTVTYSINPLPVANDFPKSFCEDFPVGSNKVDNINLTAADVITGVTGGAANRVVTWFEDAAATTTPIATPTDYDIIGSKVVFARVRNTITNCEDVAQVDLIIKPRPVDQPLQGKAAVCVNALELYTINPVSGATYTWTIPGGFVRFLGGGSNDFLTLVSFPTSPASGDIKVKVNLNGCDGNELVKSVSVSPTPSAFTINTPGPFICENEIGAPFSVTPNNFPSSNYNWEITPAGGALIATGQTTGNVLINFLSTNVTIRVTESNASNCAGPPQQTVVIIRQRPILADISTTICSGSASGIVLDEAVTSPVPATTFNIISAAVDPGLITSGATTGNGVGPNAIAGDVFENTTGGPLQVRYTVAPISADGCAGPSKTVTLTVNPEPLLDANLSVQRCSGEASGIILKVAVGSVPADQFIINSINANGLTPAAGNPVTGTFAAGEIADDAWINLGTTPVNVTYEISPFNSSLNCAGDPPTDVVITVFPAPQVTPTTKTICSGRVLALPLTSNIANTSFSWTVKSTSPGVSGAASGSGTTINDILVYNGVGTATVVYSVKARNPNAFLNCEGPALDVTVDINPAPSVINITQTTCSDLAGGSTHVLDLTTLQAGINSGGGLTFTWFSDALLTTQITGGSITAYPIANNTPIYVVVDNGTCNNVATVTFTVNPLPQVSALATLKPGGTGVTCNGSEDGQIVATGGPAGTSPFFYSIQGTSGPATAFTTASTFNLLKPDTYIVTLRDSKNCVVGSTPVDITEPSVIVVDGVPTDATCKSASNGSIVVNASGGIAGTYLYSLNGGPFQTSNIFSGLIAGTYVVSVKDINGATCLKSDNVTIGEPTAVTATITAQTNVDCNGNQTGSVTVLATGGSGTYLYSIDNGNTTQASGTFSSLFAGLYEVLIIDQPAGCPFRQVVNITQPAVLNLNQVSSTNVACNGQNTGAMTLSGSGGTAPYEYSIQGGAVGTFQSSGVFTNLPAQVTPYSTVVRDAKGCTALLDVLISQPAPLLITEVGHTDVLCNGGTTGTLTMNGTGGTGIYSFSLTRPSGTVDPFVASGVYTNLVAGTYMVTIRDQNNCTNDSNPIIIGEPPALTGSAISVTPVTCQGGTTGAAEIQGLGGTGAGTYQYKLNPSGAFVNSGIFTNLSFGHYEVVVRDANGCTFTVPFDVSEPAALTGTIATQVDVLCNGELTGSVIISAGGGTPAGTGYEFSLNGGPVNNTGFFDNLAASTTPYNVRIQDDNDCFIIIPVTITQPTMLVPSIVSQVNVDCNGNGTGKVTLGASGGVGPYQFSDQPATGFTSTAMFENLVAVVDKSYYVRDANGCTKEIKVTITEPTPLVLTLVSTTDVLCSGQTSGVITVQGSGGSGSYEYSKEIGGVQSTFTPVNVFNGLAAGSYIIRVRDAQGCITMLTPDAVVSEPLPISGSLSQTGNVSCFLGNDGEITVTAAGGTGAYTFLLLQDPSNVAVGNVFSNVRAGSYTVRITDANNCSFTTLALPIGQPTQLKAVATVLSPYNGFQLSCEGASDGQINTTITGGTGPAFTYTISPDPNGVGSNTTGTFTNLPQGLYTVSVSDNNTCPATAIPVAINPPFPFSGGFVGLDQFICEGTAPDIIKEIVPPFGGTEDYLFQWESSLDGTSFATIPGATADTFTPPVFAPFTGVQVVYFKRIVTLANGGCGLAESNVVKITIHKLPAFTMLPIPATVCEGQPLILNLVFSQGQAPYFYDFTETSSTGVVTNHVNQVGSSTTPIPRFGYNDETTFLVTRVKDINGCEVFPNQSVTVPVTKVNANFTFTPATGQCSGSVFDFQWNADANVTYTWQWNDGTPQEVVTGTGPQTIPHIFNFPVTSGSTVIPVMLKAEHSNGCPARQTLQNITIFPTVIAVVRPVDNIICSGETIFFENLTDNVSDNRWYYRVKGTTDVTNELLTYNASYQFVNDIPANPDPIIYEVVYEASNTDGCSDTEMFDITVYKKAAANFDPGVIPELTGGESIVTFTNTSNPIDPGLFSYEWNFGTTSTPSDDPDNVGPIIVTYTSAGSKKVTLTVTNRAEPGCKSTATKFILIPLAPFSADFTVTPLASCTPVTLVTDNLGGGDGNGVNYTWTLRDELNESVATSNLREPTFTINQPGVYSLELIADGPGQHAEETIDNIEVFGIPIAAFFPRPKTFFVPDTPVDMVNDSQDANVFNWDFGDGETSTERDPTYRYQLEGKYIITLVAGFDHGNKDIDGDGVMDGVIVCYDTATQEVIAREGGATKIPNAFTPSPFGPNGGFDNGQDNNDVFLPITTAGVLEFKMEIFDRWGNLVFQSLQKDQGWDGYDRNGHLLPSGVYVYKLILRLADGQRTTQIGDVTLIR